MSVVGELLGFSRPDKPELPPPPEPPDLQALQEQERRRLANTGIQSRIFTSPLGLSNESGGKKKTLGE